MQTFKATIKKIALAEAPYTQIKNKYRPYDAGIAVGEAIHRLVGGAPPEAAASSSETLIGTRKSERKGDTVSINPFISAVHIAFDHHYPFALSPDDFWLCIAQGFAAHVNENAEKLRSRFVKHEGKEHIEVVRDFFVKGSADNDWPGAFGEFSDQLAQHIGKTRDLIVADFSTTGLIEKAASEIVLMDAMSAYFTYGMRTACGIPEITLLGTVEDWRRVKARAAVLAEYDLGWWIDALLPVLDKVIESAEGKADPKFWESFYHEGGGSGGPYVTGWINVLFPYLTRGKNRALDKWSRGIGDMCGGPNPSDFSLGLSKVPFTWLYYDAKFEMEFLGGFVGVSQNEESLIVRPAIGWAVRDEPAAK